MVYVFFVFLLVMCCCVVVLCLFWFTFDLSWTFELTCVIILVGEIGGRPSRLREVLFGISQPAFSRLRPIEGTEGEFFIPFNKGLNQPQKEAIAFALSANDLALIHGPPGNQKQRTNKTNSKK